MKIEHLEEFLDLAETLNFTRTAKHFYITQPVLSKHIAVLEQELGGKLLTREKNRIGLTPLGTALLPSMKDLIDDKQRIINEARAHQASETSRLKVGYLLGAAGNHIPEIQRRFHTLHPHVTVEYFSYEFDKIFEYLSTSSVDMVIGGLTLSLSEDSYVIRKVYADTYYALTTVDDPLASLREVSATDLAGKTVVVPAPSFFARDTQALDEWLDADANRITVVESVHDINAAPLSVKINDAVGLTFGHLASHYGSEYEFVPLKNFDKTLDIAVIWRRSAQKPFFDDFARITREVIEDIGY